MYTTYNTNAQTYQRHMQKNTQSHKHTQTHTHTHIHTHTHTHAHIHTHKHIHSDIFQAISFHKRFGILLF